MEKQKLTDLVAKYILQEMQDFFLAKNDMVVGISGTEGEYLTDAGELNDFCEEYIKKTPEGKRRCDECDCKYAKKAFDEKKSFAYECHAGLIDFTAPIFVGDDFYGFIVGGQVCKERPRREKVEELAKELLIEDVEGFYEASQKTHIVTDEQLNNSIDLVGKIATMISDIADNKLQVIKASKEIELAARMKSDFLANMSHEIRTPMNAIIGMADMALRESLPPDAKSYVTQIKRSGKTLLSIINDILDFSKIESGKMDISLAEYSLVELINDISNIIVTRIGDKDVELIIDIPPDVPGILMGDENRIKQIITNLANNAVKFTNEGRVKLTVTCDKTSPNSYDLSVAVEDTGIGIKPEDLEKIFESFQQVDSKRNRNIEGTGLGLAISKQLVNLMQGSINVESEYEYGSTFSFKIPQIVFRDVESEKVKDISEVKTACLLSNAYTEYNLIQDIQRIGGSCDNIYSIEMLDDLPDVKYLFTDPENLRQISVDKLNSYTNLNVVLLLDFNDKFEDDRINNLIRFRKPAYTYNLIKLFNHDDFVNQESNDDVVDIDFIAPDAKILIVDDNEVNLSVAAGLLKPMKMQVDTAISGMKAVEMISSTMYDLVFMDHMMPQMDGIETTHIIRRFHPEYDVVPIIALTANAMAEAKGMFLTEGMNDFLPKPIEMKVMLNMLKTWLPADKIISVDPNELKLDEDACDYDVDIPELDIKGALALIGSKETLYNVIESYYKMIPKKKGKIAELYANEDWEQYTIEVHALKSSSRQIGAAKLGNMAAELEIAGNESNIEYIKANHQAMMEEYEGLEIALSKHITIEEELPGELDTDASITLSILDRVSEAIENLDFTTITECIDELKQYNYQGEEETLFRQLIDANDNMEVDICEVIVMSWRALIE